MRAATNASLFNFFSVQPLCSLCLCGSLFFDNNNHRDTENTEVAQRRISCFFNEISSSASLEMDHCLEPDSVRNATDKRAQPYVLFETSPVPLSRDDPRRFMTGLCV